MKRNYQYFRRFNSVYRHFPQIPQQQRAKKPWWTFMCSRAKSTLAGLLLHYSSTKSKGFPADKRKYILHNVHMLQNRRRQDKSQNQQEGTQPCVLSVFPFLFLSLPSYPSPSFVLSFLPFFSPMYSSTSFLFTMQLDGFVQLSSIENDGLTLQKEKMDKVSLRMRLKDPSRCLQR